MSSLRQIGLIAYRDLLQRARSRAFLVSMLVVVGLVVMIGPILAFEMRDPPTWQVGVVGEEPEGLAEALATVAAPFERGVELTRYGSLEVAEEHLRSGDVEVLIVDGEQLVWHEEMRATLAGVLNAAVASATRAAVAEELGLAAEEVAALVRPEPLDGRALVEPDPEAGPRRVAAYAGTMLLYVSILLFGQFVALGVLEEKSSRVVEVVLSRARPHHLLAGKVIGIGFLGLVQLLVLGGAVLFTVRAFDIADVDLSALSISVLGAVVLWYLLGFGFFSVLYAALGATVSRQEDAQSVLMIPALFLIPGFLISLIGLDDPESMLVRVSSLVPPLSPLVMPMRASLTQVPAWELAASIAALVGATYLLVRLGGRIYQGSILRLGAKVRLRDALRASAD